VTDRHDYLCPICEGEGHGSGECVCHGLGVVTRELASAFLLPGEPAPAPLPPPPATMEAPCVDCAFRGDSPEHDSGAIDGVLERVAAGRPFYCHQGMHLTARGQYVPREQRADGTPVGHPVCAGWARARLRWERLHPPLPGDRSQSTTERTLGHE
jgi:hypothetical protein